MRRGNPRVGACIILPSRLTFNANIGAVMHINIDLRGPVLYRSKARFEMGYAIRFFGKVWKLGQINGMVMLQYDSQ
jgi:hypothetical protein